jgi:hypothetical protein
MLARWRSTNKHARGQLSRLVNLSLSPIAGGRSMSSTVWCPCLQINRRRKTLLLHLFTTGVDMDGRMGIAYNFVSPHAPTYDDG